MTVRSATIIKTIVLKEIIFLRFSQDCLVSICFKWLGQKFSTDFYDKAAIRPAITPHALSYTLLLPIDRITIMNKGWAVRFWISLFFEFAVRHSRWPENQTQDLVFEQTKPFSIPRL